MKNVRNLFSFPLQSIKEKKMIKRGPDAPPATSETQPLTKEVQEALDAARTFHEVIAGNTAALKSLTKPTADGRSYVLEAEGYKIIFGPAFNSGIEIKKGNDVLSIIADTGDGAGVYFNHRLLASVSRDNSKGDQVLLKEKIVKFRDIIARALKESDEKVRGF